MIVWSQSLDRDSRFRADREWRHFLEHYGDSGWIVRDIPGTGKKLFLRTDLIPRESGQPTPVRSLGA
jgi:hypothetical protein